MYDDHIQSSKALTVPHLGEIVAIMEHLTPKTPWSVLNYAVDGGCFHLHVRAFGFGTLDVVARDGHVFRVEVSPIQQRGDVLANEPNF